MKNLSNIKLNKDLDEFLSNFIKNNKKQPKILHIGNIANNAYNNAKLLNKVGMINHVLCHDYYDIMGCPEWDDANLDIISIKNGCPIWYKHPDYKFQRPKWFIQGKQFTCLNYIIALNKNNILKIKKHWDQLSIENNTKSNSIKKIKVFIDNFTNNNNYLIPIQKSYKSIKVFFKAIPIIKDNHDKLRAVILDPKKSMYYLFNSNAPLNSIKFHKKCNSLIKDFTSLFPERKDKLCYQDLANYRNVSFLWRKALSHYDLVIGYGTCTIFPMLFYDKPYMAYEHGTIRDLPFENSTIGRLTALSYAKAKTLYMTNADSIAQAKHLCSNSKIIYGLHGFDENRIQSAIRHNKCYRFGVSKNTPLFFAPARHHWKNGYSTWLKGNDKILHAANKLKDERLDFKIVFIDWGAEVHLTKELINKLDLHDYIIWHQPLKKHQLWSAIASADCIIDQFVLPCMGSITLDSVLIGKAPVITLLNDGVMSNFFGEKLPALNCKNPDEIALAMKSVIKKLSNSPQPLCQLKVWFDKNHSTNKLLNTLVEGIEHSIST